MIKKPDQTAMTRKNLMDAFWLLYEANRTGTLTVREITKKAGYNRSTFYAYFTDVQDVLAQWEQSLIPSTSQLPPFTNGATELGMPLDPFMALYEQNSRYYAVLLGENGDPSFAGKLKEATKPAIRQALMGKTRLGGTELEILLEFMLSAMIGVMSFWFREGKPLPKERLSELMRSITEDGAAKML